MSKGNMFLGLARGSVGDITFYRRNAQQITRVKVRNVKNPQTDAQMYQRAINRTAVQAYGVLKSICDHSYEGVSYGANSYAKFLSLNMNMLRLELATEQRSAYKNKAFLPKDINGCVAMPFVVAKGSINPIQSVGGQPGGTFASLQITTTGGAAYDMGLLRIAEVTSSLNTITYKQFAEYIGAKQGDQLTIMKVDPSIVAGEADEPVGVAMQLARIILDTAQDDWSETEFFGNLTEIGDGSIVSLRVNNPNVRNEGDALFIAEINGNKASLYATVGMTEAGATDAIGYSAILSRQKEDGSWLRSNANLAYNPDYRENGYTIKQASTLVPVDVVVESDYYLNNAE